MHIETVCVRIAAGVSVLASFSLHINVDIWSTRIFPAAASEIRSAAGDNKGSLMRWSKINQYYEA